jgi:tRNA U34 5-carboxymethylaminomethyl modifying enzyme MnmG/GidA
MPEELQEAMLRTVPGLENVKMVRPAYGVEYDFVDPRELARTSCYRFVPALATLLSCSNT